MAAKFLPLPRRTFLRGAGVALGLPLLEAMWPAVRPVRAADAVASPMRLVCLGNPLGMLPDAFFPSATGADYELPEALQDLKKHRKSFTVFSHLDHGLSGGHRVIHSFLTGLKDSEAKDWPDGNISVDQRAAEAFGAQTRFPSLVLSAGAEADGDLNCKLSWTRNAVNVPPIARATDLFRALFVKEDAESRRLRAETDSLDESILDAVNEQAKLLAKRLGQTDRRKFDEYLTSVREVERKLNMSQVWRDRPKPQVALPMPTEGGIAYLLPVMYDLLALALETDSTRVASLSCPASLDTGDLGLEGSYHGFSHHGKAETLRNGLLVIERFQMSQLARFLDKLAGVVQPDGATLLDRTIVLFGSGMGNGSSHSNKDLPVLVAGGGFRHGEHKKYPTEPNRRVPLCNLYTSLLQRCGVEIPRFNNASGTLTNFS
jgi:hypothetical protein